MGSISDRLAMTKYMMEPRVATGRYFSLAALIISSVVSASNSRDLMAWDVTCTRETRIICELICFKSSISVIFQTETNVMTWKLAWCVYKELLKCKRSCKALHIDSIDRSVAEIHETVAKVSEGDRVFVFKTIIYLWMIGSSSIIHLSIRSSHSGLHNSLWVSEEWQWIVTCLLIVGSGTNILFWGNLLKIKCAKTNPQKKSYGLKYVSALSTHSQINM